jgi:hypothetical protein
MINRNEFLDATAFSQKPQIFHKFINLVMDADWLTIHKNQSVSVRVQLIPGHKCSILHSQVYR